MQLVVAYSQTRKYSFISIRFNNRGSFPIPSQPSLRANADDRLTLGPLGRTEGNNGVVEGSDVAEDNTEFSVNKIAGLVGVPVSFCYSCKK
jgi:hypothetical protein